MLENISTSFQILNLFADPSHPASIPRMFPSTNCLSSVRRRSPPYNIIRHPPLGLHCSLSARRRSPSALRRPFCLLTACPLLPGSVRGLSRLRQHRFTAGRVNG